MYHLASLSSVDSIRTILSNTLQCGGQLGARTAALIHSWGPPPGAVLDHECLVQGGIWLQPAFCHLVIAIAQGLNTYVAIDHTKEGTVQLLPNGALQQTPHAQSCCIVQMLQPCRYTVSPMDVWHPSQVPHQVVQMPLWKFQAHVQQLFHAVACMHDSQQH